MKLKLVFDNPPIPYHNWDWRCFDEDSDYSENQISGAGSTPEAAILDFVAETIEKSGIGVSEIMALEGHQCRSDCRRIGCEAVEQAQRRTEMLS